MNIIVDENIPKAEACFGLLGQVIRVPGRSLSQADLRQADALIVRSITQVNEALLQQTPVTFVGTATIGTDHVDQAYLQRQGIGFASAPGCNARSVAEYVFAALLELEHSRGMTLSGKTLGIIGLGNVGTQVKCMADAFGMRVLACDPIKQRAGEPGLVDANSVWQADIVTLHVPYETTGTDPTHHLANATRIEAMKADAVLVNTARGAVVDNLALSRILEDRYDLSVVLDVWEGEPLLNRRLANQVDIATPHIAGYSYDGKVQGTWMVYQALCQYLQRPCECTLPELLPSISESARDFHFDEVITPQSARQIVKGVYDICEDDDALRASLQLSDSERSAAFDRLRKQYRVRREFTTVCIRASEDLSRQLPEEEYHRLRALGFRMA